MLRDECKLIKGDIDHDKILILNEIEKQSVMQQQLLELKSIENEREGV